MSLNNSLDAGLEQSKYHDFVAFTSTFYKDDVEGKVRSEAFFEMIKNAQKLGIRVVVGDGGSGNDFLERARIYDNVTLIPSGRGGNNKDHSMGGERRYAGKIATEYFPEANYFLWLEPEKTDLMSEASIDAILEPMRSGEANIIVPSRKSKETLPPQQRAAENRANKRAMNIFDNGKMGPAQIFKSEHLKAYHGHAHGIAMDMGVYSDGSRYDLWFGPKAFTRSSMEEDFLTYKGAKWDGIITSVLAGKQKGKNVVDVPVDFTYPSDQTQLETDPAQAKIYQEKRRSQYRYILKTVKNLVSKI